ncbi:hypothetical protein AAHA92_32538 [Salvia divinorum]|uniref:Uncharacterized protein n=1 Tax=Salvia divinorum TaxID=28513 RepID=A0ABD1FL27_SALDI
MCRGDVRTERRGAKGGEQREEDKKEKETQRGTSREEEERNEKKGRSLKDLLVEMGLESHILLAASNLFSSERLAAAVFKKLDLVQRREFLYMKIAKDVVVDMDLEQRLAIRARFVVSGDYSIAAEFLRYRSFDERLAYLVNMLP